MDQLPAAIEAAKERWRIAAIKLNDLERLSGARPATGLAAAEAEFDKAEEELKRAILSRIDK